MAFKLSNLLVKSPFPRVHELMDAARRCTDVVPALIEAVSAGDQAEVEKLAKRASQLEGEADVVKNALRGDLPKGLLMTVDRRDMLRLISEIDAIADAAEDIGVLLTLRPLTVPEDMQTPIQLFVERVIETVDAASDLVHVTAALVETGFSGKPRERADALIREVGRREHEADKLQDQCAKLLFKHENDMSPIAILMWTKVLNKLGGLANHAENVGDQYRLFLAR